MNGITQSFRWSPGSSVRKVVAVLVLLLIIASSTFSTTLAADAPLRAARLQATLTKGYSAHYLALEPTQRDATITLTLIFGPKENSQVGGQLNLWVLSPEGVRALKDGDKPADLAIAAGNPTVLDSDESEAEIFEREATFKASGRPTYTVIVYSRAPIPASYTLTIDNAILIDASGQTAIVGEESKESLDEETEE